MVENRMTEENERRTEISESHLTAAIISNEAWLMRAVTTQRKLLGIDGFDVIVSDACNKLDALKADIDKMCADAKWRAEQWYIAEIARPKD